MPRYEYLHPATGEMLEVRHSIREQLSTWGELCERLGLEPGPIDLATPVERRVNTGFLITDRRSSSPGHVCSGGDCCH